MDAEQTGNCSVPKSARPWGKFHPIGTGKRASVDRTDQLPDVSLEQSSSQPRGWLFKARKGNECSKPGSEIVIHTQKRSSKRRNSAGQLLAKRLQMR